MKETAIFFIVRIPIFIVCPIIWLLGHLFDQPKASKFGRFGSIITSSILAVLIFIGLVSKKSL